MRALRALTGTAVLLAACSGSSDAELAEHPVAPASAGPISPSYAEFVSDWNAEVTAHRPEWLIEDPPRPHGSTFELAVTDRIHISGMLNPRTNSVVEVDLLVVGDEEAEAAERDRHQEADRHANDHEDEGEDGHHHAGDASIGPVVFDRQALNDAAAATIAASSSAPPTGVDEVMIDMGISAAAEADVEDADGEEVDVIAHGRRFRRQRLPTFIAVIVRVDEPWDWSDTAT